MVINDITLDTTELCEALREYLSSKHIDCTDLGNLTIKSHNKTVFSIEGFNEDSPMLMVTETFKHRI